MHGKLQMQPTWVSTSNLIAAWLGGTSMSSINWPVRTGTGRETLTWKSGPMSTSNPRSAKPVAITLAPLSCPSWPIFATKIRGLRPSIFSNSSTRCMAVVISSLSPNSVLPRQGQCLAAVFTGRWRRNESKAMQATGKDAALFFSFWRRTMATILLLSALKQLSANALRQNATMGGDSSVVECPPFNWKVGGSTHGHAVNRIALLLSSSPPFAKSVHHLNRHEAINSRLLPIAVTKIS